MTFKPGDKVKFLNDVGGGIVRRVNRDTAYVETDDGFEIPTSLGDLILMEPGEPVPDPRKNPRQEQKSGKAYQTPVNRNAISAPVDLPEIDDAEVDVFDDEDIITNENCTLNILLGLVPIKTKGYAEPKFRVYLISDCAYRMLYTFSVVKENFCYGRRSGLVEEDTKIAIDEFKLYELKEIQSFKISCIFFKKGIYLPHEPLLYEYKVDALSMADPGTWRENDFFDEKALVINLTEESLIYEIERMVTENEEKFIIQKKKRDSGKKSGMLKAPEGNPAEEVDLHIEQLVDDYSGYTAGEILDLQMSRFNIALEGAIRNRQKRIIFIHGVGNGKLKYEIRKTLDSKYPRLRYQDASFKEYGYGATMIMIK